MHGGSEKKITNSRVMLTKQANFPIGRIFVNVERRQLLFFPSPPLCYLQIIYTNMTTLKVKAKLPNGEEKMLTFPLRSTVEQVKVFI